MTYCSLSEFTGAYIEAALWSSVDDDGRDVDDIAPETLAAMRADCRAFYIANEAAIWCDGGPQPQAAMAGHDFWLTRCGHGAGFWDGDWPEPHAQALTDAAEAFGNIDLYLGDDGKVWA
tara:strand:+ start:788 stop:1144 length:357 start_codon:yes stop_codon:yes gene_type:complete